MDHFNVASNVNKELDAIVSTHETPIGMHPSGAVAKQQVYILTWQLCVAQTTRVINESTPGNLNLLMEAISLNDARGGGGRRDEDPMSG
jgi:hypothetical protein